MNCVSICVIWCWIFTNVWLICTSGTVRIFLEKFRMRIVKSSCCSWNLDISCGFIRHLHSLATEFPAETREFPADSYALHGAHALGLKAKTTVFRLAPWDFEFTRGSNPASSILIFSFTHYFNYALSCSCLLFTFFFSQSKIHKSKKIYIQNS